MPKTHKRLPAFAVDMSVPVKGEPSAIVSAEQVVAFRLSRHHLARRSSSSALPRVAGDMVGVQAQVMAAARMSLWARTRGLRSDDVGAALWRDRTLAKVWCMRGTTHLVPSEDVTLFTRGCTRRANRSIAWMMRTGVPGDSIEPAVEIVREALDRPLTRKELADRLAKAHRTTTRRFVEVGWGSRSVSTGLEVGGTVVSLSDAVFLGCMRGILVAGPEKGNEATFVRTDAWLPRGRDLTVERAESELLRRYLRAYGPAMISDFAMWTYMTAADAREIWARNDRELARVDVDGRPGWVLRSDVSPLERARLEPGVLRLLPHFDTYLLGHKDKGHLVDAAHYKRVYRAAGWLSPVLLVSGRAAGVWSHEREGRRLAVRIEPFKPLPRSLRSAIDEEADGLRRFLGAADVSVRVTSVARP